MKSIYVVTTKKTKRSKPVFVGVSFNKKDAVTMYRKTARTKPDDTMLYEATADDLHYVTCHSWVHFNLMTEVMPNDRR